MIPDFNESGYLPPGIYLATIDEIESRFGTESELRRVQMQSLRWLLDLARGTDVARIVINGSFVTEEIEPNDVDCALLLDDNLPRTSRVAEKLTDGLPFLQIELVNQRDFDWLTQDFYATDRFGIGKGVVEVIQWT